MWGYFWPPIMAIFSYLPVFVCKYIQAVIKNPQNDVFKLLLTLFVIQKRPKPNQFYKQLTKSFQFVLIWSWEPAGAHLQHTLGKGREYTKDGSPVHLRWHINIIYSPKHSKTSRVPEANCHTQSVNMKGYFSRRIFLWFNIRCSYHIVHQLFRLWEFG